MMQRVGGMVVVLLLLVSGVSAQDRIVVLTETGTPVVATEILIPVGPAQEETGQSGISHLAARSVVAQVQRGLDSLGAVVSVTPHKDAISISVIAAPDAWERATRDVILGLFRDPLEAAHVTAQRSAIASELRGRLANPADVATREMDLAFFGTTHPWGRSAVGTAESVERMTFAQVDEFLRDHYTTDRALIAVVGPVEASDALRHLRPLVGAGAPAEVSAPAFRSAERPVRREYNSITTWVSASYRLAARGDIEAFRFLAYLAAESLSFSPSQRSVYDVSADVVPRIGGGEIRLQVVVPPEEASDWAERVETAIPAIASTAMPDDVFENHLRRFRGFRLVRLVAPEDRAREAARQLLVEGRLVGIVPELDQMTMERVRAAARTLGSPAVMLLGPTLDAG